MHAENKSARPRRLVILGATGSVGRAVARVIAANPGLFEVEAVVGGRDGAALARTALALKARHAALYDPVGRADFEAAYAALRAAEDAAVPPIGFSCGAQAVDEAAARPCDLVIAAIVGTIGIAPTLAAIRAGRRVALANKETLVCAGACVMALASKHNSEILPLDSEHNAIYQALGGRDVASLTHMTLTASGGPFLRWSAPDIARAGVADALAHPRWRMGAKISVDSASLMNKGLELIEAHHLFGVAAERLDVLVHPQSIVHGLIGFEDGSVLAGLAMPDMAVPVAFCLGLPVRIFSPAPRLDLASLGVLTFEKPDEERFPALKLARAALREQKGLPTVMNAANEIAVSAFLLGKISFGAMVAMVEESCNLYLQKESCPDPQNLEDALAIHHIGKNIARSLL